MKILCAGLIALMSATAANATPMTWAFQGNEYSGTGDDLAGEVTVTLDDEGTPGSVKVKVDATALPGTSTDSISFIYFNTVFDSDLGPFMQTNATNNAGGSFKSGANNEDGFIAGNTIPALDDGPLFDFRLSFNAPADGSPFFDQVNDIFEATLTRPGLTVSDFLTLSAPNANPGGDQGPFEVALRAVQLSTGQGGGFFAGERAVPVPGALPLLAGGLSAMAFFMRRRRARQA